MQLDFEDFLTPAEVARLADPPVTPAAVRLWTDSGRLPCLRTPAGLRLVRRGDALHYLADRRQAQGSGTRRRG